MTSGPSVQDPAKAAVKLRRLDFLDALRGLAACWVVFYHMIFLTTPNLVLPAWAHMWAVNGGTGVTLFFVISAFSLFYTMPARLHEQMPWLSYTLHRIFRIAPLFYLWIILTMIRDHLVFHVTHSWSEIAASGSFVFNLVPQYQQGFVWASWTIGVEMLFYVTFPFIYTRVKNLWSAAALVMGCILTWMFCQLVIEYLAIGQVSAASMQQWFFPRFLPEFAVGVFAYFVLKKTMPWSDRHPETAKGFGMLLILLATYLFIAVMRNVGDLGLPDNRNTKAVCCLLVLVGLSLRSVKPLVNKLTVYLGKISYSLYLGQPTLIYLLGPVYNKIYAHVGNLSVAFIACSLLTFAILIPFAALTYRWVERPGVRLGKRCYAWLDSRHKARGDTAQPQPG